jgi:hypothetical protein
MFFDLLVKQARELNRDFGIGGGNSASFIASILVLDNTLNETALMTPE